jgi:hypothetical protein
MRRQFTAAAPVVPYSAILSAAAEAHCRGCGRVVAFALYLLIVSQQASSARDAGDLPGHALRLPHACAQPSATGAPMLTRAQRMLERVQRMLTRLRLPCMHAPFCCRRAAAALSIPCALSSALRPHSFFLRNGLVERRCHATVGHSGPRPRPLVRSALTGRTQALSATPPLWHA